MDKLTDFTDKMFLIKGNQLTALDKHSTNILEEKASVYYLGTTKTAITAQEKHQVRSRNRRVLSKNQLIPKCKVSLLWK